jgi:hypothetical protein
VLPPPKNPKTNQPTKIKQKQQKNPNQVCASKDIIKKNKSKPMVGDKIFGKPIQVKD